jgi:hypothetical protein
MPKKKRKKEPMTLAIKYPVLHFTHGFHFETVLDCGHNIVQSDQPMERDLEALANRRDPGGICNDDRPFNQRSPMIILQDEGGLDALTTLELIIVGTQAENFVVTGTQFAKIEDAEGLKQEA